jgi:tRNA G26 N,N-dimethylase Trm1
MSYETQWYYRYFLERRMRVTAAKQRRLLYTFYDSQHNIIRDEYRDTKHDIRYWVQLWDWAIERKT